MKVLRKPKLKRGDLNNREAELVSRLGVYAIWLLTHGKRLDPRNIGVRRIKAAYRAYFRKHYKNDHAEAMDLLRSIDAYCRRTGWERPSNFFPDAMRSLLAQRGVRS